MARVDIDFSDRTVQIDLVHNEYTQSTNVCNTAALHRRLQFVRVERGAPGIIKIVYFDPHHLQYIIKTIQNRDSDGNIKASYAGPLTWNAQKVQLFRGVSDSLTAKATQEARVEVVPQPATDLQWKSDVRFYGVRDALIGAVPFSGHSHY